METTVLSFLGALLQFCENNKREKGSKRSNFTRKELAQEVAGGCK
jgi:hypothetical protein